jgi:NAD(P)-dependent dehydrogenase (short-subunit alcohol dehydrogenase family)
MSDVRFDGRVALVTGSGGGLGRAYAKLLASRGAKVVVNDLGGSVDGTGSGTRMAEQVVNEIKEAGGEAVPDFNGVDTYEGGAKMVQTALDAYGKLDIVIHNAGILRDKSFKNMTEEDFDKVLTVHLKGAFNVMKHAFPVMRDNGFGRVVFATSAAGLFGNFGQVNYSSAKMGLVGFMNSLAIEGKKYDVKVNCIAPGAASRMTENLMPPELLEKMKPEYVAPAVAYMASEECAFTGTVISAAGGVFSRVAIMENEGVLLDPAQGITIERFRENLDRITDMSGAEVAEGMGRSMAQLMSLMSH